MGKHRKKLKIIADILSVAKDGAKKTHIMYQANLSFTLMDQYLRKVVNLGLVNRIEGEYLLTSRGVTFLDVFSDYERKCKEFNCFSDRLGDLKTKLEDVLEGNVNLN